MTASAVLSVAAVVGIIMVLALLFVVHLP